MPGRYLIVDGHSIIFAWPELRKLHAQRPALAREALVKKLRQYQDWTGVNVAVVFDGRGARVSEQSDPHDVQIFYARRDQSADAIVERLASKYASRFDVTVATSDFLEMETVNASGAACVSPDGLRKLLEAIERR
ncbi:MAG TPA: NYN domain-containing protein [Chthoniobacterales bacterium]|nr:NYN domain-containing protein [Chthoniobacterales bacterium]